MYRSFYNFSYCSVALQAYGTVGRYRADVGTILHDSYDISGKNVLE